MTDPIDHQNLDPEDWQHFRATAHQLLDACIDHMSNAREHPWRGVSPEQIAKYRMIGKPQGLEAISDRMKQEILPYATGNTHPRFFGWVHGTGLASGLLSEMVTAAMNSNCGGRDHGLNYVERAVIEWSRDVMGFPETASGVLVSGTSQATVIALACARQRALPQSRKAGLNGARLVAYAAAGAHNAILKSMELLGFGSDALRRIEETDAGMAIGELHNRIIADRADGFQPFAIIGTAGSVDLGRFDDLEALADLAVEKNLWLHVDGAFGAWTRLARDPWRQLSDGIGRADSIACDFHKWMYVPYDCGLVLVRNESEHKATFAARPAYLAGQGRGLGGGEPWACDYGIDLSRGSRALKVWAAIEAYGTEALGAAISSNCLAASYMASRIAQDARMDLAAPVISNLCVFTADASLPKAEQSRLNSIIAEELQLAGLAVFSTTTIDGKILLRAAITNHRTRSDDIEASIAAIANIRDGIGAPNSNANQ